MGDEQPKEQLSGHIQHTCEHKPEQKNAEIKIEKPKLSLKQSLIHFYDTKYRKILFFTLSLLILSVFLIGLKIAKTGDFVEKDISLSGGMTITIFHEQSYDIKELQNYLASQFPDKQLSIRSLTQLGKTVGIIVEGTDIDSDKVIASLGQKIGTISAEDYSVSMMGSSLGNTFFRETLKAIFVSFMFMGLVVFLYFGENLKMKFIATIATFIVGAMIFGGTTSIIKDFIAYILGLGLITLYYKNNRPSFIMILTVFADLVVTLAVVNLLGMKISTAGIASFLMIIGYCVETNILLTTKVTKKKEGSVIERILDAFKTGFIMTATAVSAVLIALVFTQSDVIKEIMAILLIGLIADMIYTWGQNVALLRIYLEKKSANHELHN